MALVLALSICSQTVAIVAFPETNVYYGMVATYGTAAYSLLEDHKLASRSGDLAAVKGFDRRSQILKSDYVEIGDLLPALKQTTPGDVLFYYPPGYPLYLAGTFVVSHDFRYTTARRIQQLLNIVGVPTLLLITGHLLGCFPVGFAAAFLYGLFAAPAQQTFYILPDGLMPFVATLLLTAGVWCVRRDRLAAYAVLGFVLGVAANLRSDALGIGVFLALGIWRWRGRLDVGTLSRVGIMALMAFVPLIPYGLIQLNFKPVGRFRVTSPGIGQNLWEAYGETKNPHGVVVLDSAVDEMIFQKTGRRVLHLPEGEALLKKMWLEAALRDPGWFIWSVWNRFKTVLIHWRTGVRPPFVASALSSATQSLLIRVFNGGMARLSFAVLACAVATVLLSRFGLVVVSAPLSYLVAFSVLHLEQRYVIPALGPLVFSGCYGVSLIAARLSRSRVQVVA